MEENITVRVGGDSSSARSALSELVPILNQLREQMQQTQNNFRDSTPHVQNFGNSILSATQGVWGFVQQALMMTTGISLASFFADAANEVRNLTDQMFQLNVQTERNAFAWQYLYSTGNGPDKGVSQELMKWSSQFSMQIPFTRQDLMGAITSLAMTGLSAQGVEHYMPTLADLAATSVTRGGQPVSLQTAAYAVMEAQMGMTRMLKFDLQINPGDLTKYGLKLSAGEMGRIENPEMLMPALQAYAADRGRAGAASGAAHETWWGTYSSFIDRLQNFGLQAGGTSLSGDVTKGSTFGMLKQYLDDINAWLDAHKDQLQFLGDWIARVGGQGLKDLTAGFEGFASGLQEAGAIDMAKQLGQNFMDWLSDPKTAQNMRDIGHALGTDVIPALKTIGSDFKTMGDDFGTVKDFLTNSGMWDIFLKAGQVAMAVLTVSVQSLTLAVKEMYDLFMFVQSHGDQKWLEQMSKDAVAAAAASTNAVTGVVGGPQIGINSQGQPYIIKSPQQIAIDAALNRESHRNQIAHPGTGGYGVSPGIAPTGQTTNNVAQVTNQFFATPQALVNSAVQASLGQQASDWNSAWRQPGGWNFFTAGAF